MSLGKQFVELLREVTATENEHTALQTLDNHLKKVTLESADGNAQLTLFDVDRYSLTMHTLTVGSIEAASLSDMSRARQLDVFAASIIKQLHYLEEPLRVCERDSESGIAQIRSTVPQREEGELNYWEALLSAGENPSVSLTRYRWTPELPEREAQPYPLAFAHLRRIVDSLQAALTSNVITE